MIPVKWFLKGTAGVLAYGLVCAGPPDTMMATPPRLRIGFRQGWWGPTWFRCVPPRAQAHLAHSARAPNVAHQTCLVRLGPRCASRAWRAWHAWRTSPQRRAHGVGFGSQKLSIQRRSLNMLRLGCYLYVGRAGGSERDGLRQGSNLTPPPTPCPGPGREGPRAVRASKMAHDGSKKASESPRLPPRWLKMAQDGPI